MLTPKAKPLTLAITKGPSLTSASNYMRVNVVIAPSILTPCIIVMCGRRDPLDSYPEVRHSTSSRRLPQKCTSLEPNIILPKYPDLGPRLDLGCGKKLFVKPSLPQPVKFISGIGSGYWILECAKLWRVCPRPYRRRSNKPTYFYTGALSELRVRR